MNQPGDGVRAQLVELDKCQRLADRILLSVNDGGLSWCDALRVARMATGRQAFNWVGFYALLDQVADFARRGSPINRPAFFLAAEGELCGCVACQAVNSIERRPERRRLLPARTIEEMDWFRLLEAGHLPPRQPTVADAATDAPSD